MFDSTEQAATITLEYRATHQYKGNCPSGCPLTSTQDLSGTASSSACSSAAGACLDSGSVLTSACDYHVGLNDVDNTGMDNSMDNGYVELVKDLADVVNHGPIIFNDQVTATHKAQAIFKSCWEAGDAAKLSITAA